MVMVYGSKGKDKGGRGGQQERAKTSKSVRLDDLHGFVQKFNMTGFKCEKKRAWYYYMIKCYEQMLRGKDASAVSKKRYFVKYNFIHDGLKSLPDLESFRSLKKADKFRILTNLLKEQCDDPRCGSEQQSQLNGRGKMEVDEGSSADLGPQYSIHEASSCHGDPPRRSLTCLAEQLHDLVSEVKRKASGRSDNSLLDVERWKQWGMQIISKLEDADNICDSLGLDSSNTRKRSRLEEIFAQLEEDIMDNDPPNDCGKPSAEVIGLQESYSQASNFGKDVEHGAEIFASTQMHAKQDSSAIDAFPTGRFLIAHPDRSISEALNVTPSYTGRKKANLEEIHLPVTAEDLQYAFEKPTMEVTAGDLQYPFDKPTMEASGHPLGHPHGNDPRGNRDIYGGGCSTTMPCAGESSGSQPALFQMGDLIPIEPFTFGQTTLEPWTGESSGSEPALFLTGFISSGRSSPTEPFSTFGYTTLLNEPGSWEGSW